MPHKILLLSLALLVLLCGCGRSTPTRYYLLESALGPVKADSLPSKTLRVAQVTVPDYLDRNSIVSRVNGQTELIVSQFHAWAEPVGHGVRRVVQEVLTAPMLAAGFNVLAAGDDTRADYVLLVTEPTPFGLSALRLTVEVLRQMGMDFGVVINRTVRSESLIHDYCHHEAIDILGELPADRRIAEAYAAGRLIVEALPGYRPLFRSILEACLERVTA